MSATRITALNQLVAVRKDVQSATHEEITRLHRESMKPQLLAGFTKTYRRIREEDAELPGEKMLVQLRLEELLGEVREQFTRRWDVTAAVDWTNSAARADVVVGEVTLIREAPVSWLIYLEKQLDNLRTIIDRLPVLDPAEVWHWDGNANAWMTDRVTTIRSKKEPRTHVLVPPTDRHPAQAQLLQEDVPVGYWDMVKYSGAIEGARRKQLLERVTALRLAVKSAREQANMTEAVQPRPAAGVLDYILAP